MDDRKHSNWVAHCLPSVCDDLDYSSNEAQGAFVLIVEAGFIIYDLQSVHSDITSLGTLQQL